MVVVNVLDHRFGGCRVVESGAGVGNHDQHVALIVGAASFLIAAGSWWLMALWVAALTALTGGEAPVVVSWRQRTAALLAALYLLA